MEPDFIFVPKAGIVAVASDTGTAPFDLPGVEYTHVGRTYHVAFNGVAMRGGFARLWLTPLH